MLMQRLWRYLIGYLVIRVNGLSLEKFVNICMANGVHLWDIQRESYTVLTAGISVADFYRLRPLVKRVRCRVHILEKRGALFLSSPLRRRAMLGMGLFMSAVLVLLVSQFVWKVEVSGPERVDHGAVMQFLEEAGIRPGVVRSSIDKGDIEYKLISAFPDFAFVGVRLHGVKLQIEIVETVLAPNLVEPGHSGDVVAAKAGVIAEIIPLSGTPRVRVGEAVSPGQLLIQGSMESAGSQRMVKARGLVMARVWYPGSAKVDLELASTYRTGNASVRRTLFIGSFQVVISGGAPDYERYEAQERRRMLPGGVFPGIYVLEETFYELEVDTGRADMDAIYQIAAQLAEQQARNALPEGVAVVDKRVEYSIIEDKMVLCTLYLETIEDIAVPARDPQ